MGINDDRCNPVRTPAPTGFALVCVVLGVELLTFCGGKTEGNTGSGGQPGFGGHTSACVVGICATGGANPSGFAGEGGSAREAGLAGDVSMGQAGLGGDGFAGHTAICFTDPCAGGCGCRSGCPCNAGGGGMKAEAGDGENPEASIVGVDAALEASSAEASLMAMASASTIAQRSCYALSGYEPASCLPIDDSLLPWLSNVPTGCQPHVTAGPFASVDASEGKTCCYSVACE